MVQDNYSLLPEQKDDGTDSSPSDLKAIRECKGLTLKDIFKATRISVVNLEAIENNDLHLLPAPVYAKTFIKIYAKALGVDSKNILDRYAKYLSSLDSPLAEEQREKPRRKIVIPPPVLIWSAAGLIFCSLLFLSLSLRHKTATDGGSPTPAQQTAKPADSIGPETSPAVTAPPAPKAEGAPPPASKVAASPTAAPARETVRESIGSQPAIPGDRAGNRNPQDAVAPVAPYHVTITAKEVTWIKIVSDQDTPYEILLKPGEKIERRAREVMQLHVGNAGGIDAEFQGKSLGVLGKSGEVVHLKLP